MPDHPCPTLDALLRALGDAEAPVRVTIDGAPLGAGFHVTEVRRADIAALDCGRGERRWREAVVEVLDGPEDARPMAPGTLAGLARESVRRLPGVGEAPLAFEVQRGAAPRVRAGAAVLRVAPEAKTLALYGEGAVCRPAARRGDPGCCAPTRGCCAA